mgnify:CR=1 FL=1
MRPACLLIACLLSTSLSASPVAALAAPCNGGLVFEDRDGDGRRDPTEPAVPGIAVSAPSITDKDKADIAFAVANDLDALALGHHQRLGLAYGALHRRGSMVQTPTLPCRA